MTKKQIVIVLTMLLLLIVVVCCSNNSLSSAPDKPFKLKVKIKESDCFRCMQGQIIMRDLSDIADVEIVFNGLNDKVINRFLQANALEYVKRVEGYKIVSDKEEYNRLNTIPSVSEGHLYAMNGDEIMTFQFRVDNITMKQLNAILRKGHVLLQKVPITLKTDYDNDKIDFSVQGDFFVLNNYPMNLCQVFNSKGEMIREIDGNLVEPSDVFSELKKMDATILRSLKDNGLCRSYIESSFIIENEIWIGFMVSCPTIVEGNVRLNTYYQLLSYSLFDSSKQYDVIYDGRPNNIVTMAFDNSSDNELFVVIQQCDEDNQFIYNQARCEKQDGFLALKDKHPIHYPDFEKKGSLSYRPVFKDGLLNLEFTEYLVDILSDTVFCLPIQHNEVIVDDRGGDIKVTKNTQLIDWCFDGKTLGVVYYDIVEGDIKQCHHLSWQKGQNGFSDKVVYLLDEETVALRLVYPDGAYYLMKGNKVGTIKQM